MWSMSSIVQFLSLDPLTAGHGRGKWIHNMWASWEACMVKLQLEGSLLKGQQYHASSNDMKDPSRCLPWLSGTSVALFAVMFRLLRDKKCDGGIQRQGAQDAIVEFLKHLFHCMFTKGPLVVHLRENCELHLHPVPPSGTAQVALTIEEDGTLAWASRCPIYVGCCLCVWCKLAQVYALANFAFAFVCVLVSYFI